MFKKRADRKPKPPPDENGAYEIAVRALGRRARSIGEVRALLAKRKAEPQDIEAVIERLRRSGYLDDARFAKAYAASRLENDRLGQRRVQRDLAARRVHPELIEKTLGSTYEEVDETRLLRDHLRRKVRLTAPPAKPAALASLYRRLLRAGFRGDLIMKELRAMGGSLFQRRGQKAGTPSVDPEKWQEWLEALAEMDSLEETAD